MPLKRKCKRGKVKVRGRCVKRCRPGQRRRKRGPRACYPAARRPRPLPRPRCNPGKSPVVGETASGGKVYRGIRGGLFICHKGRRVYLKNCDQALSGPCIQDFNRQPWCRTARQGKNCMPKTWENMSFLRRQMREGSAVEAENSRLKQIRDAQYFMA